MGLFKRKKSEKDIYKELEANANFEQMAKSKKLSEEFMDKFIDHFSPVNISAFQKLSEPFIRKHHDKLDMKIIGEYQKLSMDFIREFSYDKGFLKSALEHQEGLTTMFVREFKETYGELLGSNYLYNHVFNKTEYYEEWKDHFIWSQFGAKHKLDPKFIEKYLEKFQFSKTDMEKLGVDEEHYKEIRVGAKPLSKLTQRCEIKSGTGIIFNPSSITWYEDKIPDEYAYCKREEVITGRCNSQCDHCKYKEEYENNDWQLDN